MADSMLVTGALAKNCLHLLLKNILQLNAHLVYTSVYMSTALSSRSVRHDRGISDRPGRLRCQQEGRRQQPDCEGPFQRYGLFRAHRRGTCPPVPAEQERLVGPLFLRR